MEITLSIEQLKSYAPYIYGAIHLLYGLTKHHKSVTQINLYNKQLVGDEESVTQFDVMMLFVYRMLFGLPHHIIFWTAAIIWAVLYSIGFYLADLFVLIATRKHLEWKNLFIPSCYLFLWPPRLFVKCGFGMLALSCTAASLWVGGVILRSFYPFLGCCFIEALILAIIGEHRYKTGDE